MNKKIIILSLIIFLILAPIIGYQVVSAKTKINEKLDIINYQTTLEEYFTSYGYTIDNPNIIINPYKISPLTALIIFETPDEEEITITVEGKDPNSTYSKTYKPSKVHYLEVLGLYPDYNNTITITYNNTIKTFNLKTTPLPEDLIPIKQENNTNNLYFITSDNYTYAIDNNNEVRWYLTEKKKKKITRLDNGNLLLSTNNYLIENISTGLTEINLLGKVYREYNITRGYYGSYALTNNTILVLSNNLLEIDKQTGTIIKEYKLDNTYNTVSYNNEIITLSNNDEILEINPNTNNYSKKTNTQDLPLENKILLPIYTNNNYELSKGITFTTEETKESKENILLINYKNIDDNYNKYNINITKETDKLIITGNFQETDKLYLILDKFLDKKVYDINPKVTYQHISNKTLAGKYSIYIKINDTIYKTNNYVSF